LPNFYEPLPGFVVELRIALISREVSMDGSLKPAPLATARQAIDHGAYDRSIGNRKRECSEGLAYAA
jgi:hypothetical protein